MTSEETFWSRVDASGDCWIWTGGPSKSGYGTFRTSVTRYAHRMAYELLVGPIPPGFQIDHLCRNRMCVNPDHLEAVTGRVNTLRGHTIPAANIAKTACSKGHPYSEANTSFFRGARRCKECSRNGMRALRARRRAHGGEPEFV